MQVSFLAFWTDILSAVSDFLLTEPIVYFTGMIFLIFVVGIVKKI